MAFDGRGDSLATAGDELVARVWQVPTGTYLTEVVSQGGWMRCMDLDAPGERLAIGYGPGDIPP